GFLAWLATLGLLLVLCAAQRDWRGVRRYGALAGLCAGASLLNPYGWQLHLHIARYLSSPWIMDHVQEFQSPHIRSEGMIVFALLLLTAVSLVTQADRFEALLVLVWGFLALRSARHIPFFAISAAPLRWVGLGDGGRRRLPGRGFSGAGGGAQPGATGVPVRHAARADERPMGRLPDLPPVSARARLLRRAQRFLRPGDRLGLPQAARLRESLAPTAGPLPL